MRRTQLIDVLFVSVCLVSEQCMRWLDAAARRCDAKSKEKFKAKLEKRKRRGQTPEPCPSFSKHALLHLPGLGVTSQGARDCVLGVAPSLLGGVAGP